MPRIRYQVAMSLDGYTAGPEGEADWISMDPEIDFGALFAEFDTFIMGGRTFEAAGAMAGSGSDAKTFMPVLLGGGVPLVTLPAQRARLALKGHRVYKSGIVSLEGEIR